MKISCLHQWPTHLFSTPIWTHTLVATPASKYVLRKLWFKYCTICCYSIVTLVIAKSGFEEAAPFKCSSVFRFRRSDIVGAALCFENGLPAERLNFQPFWSNPDPKPIFQASSFGGDLWKPTISEVGRRLLFPLASDFPDFEGPCWLPDQEVPLIPSLQRRGRS